MGTIKLPSGMILKDDDTRKSAKGSITLPSGMSITPGSTAKKINVNGPMRSLVKQGDQTGSTPTANKQPGAAGAGSSTLDKAKQAIASAEQKQTRQFGMTTPQRLPYGPNYKGTTQKSKVESLTSPALPRVESGTLEAAQKIQQRAQGKTGEQLRQQNLQKIQDALIDTNNLPKSSGKQVGIGFQQQTTPQQATAPIKTSMPTTAADIPQRAQKIASKAGDSDAMYYAKAARSGLGNAVAGLQNTYNIGVMSDAEKLNGEKTDFVNPFANMNGQQGIRDNIATLANNLATNFTAALDRNPSTILRRWLTNNLVYSDEQAKEQGYSSKEEMIEDVTRKAMEATNWNDEIQQDFADTGEKKGVVKQTAASIVQNIAQMAPQIITNLVVPGTGLPMMAAQVYGNSAMEALDEGATLQQAKNRGALSAGMEYGSEKLFGGIPGLNKGLVKMGRVGDMLGEGLEEGLSTLMSGAIDRATYNPEAENATAGEILRDAAMGAAVSGVMNLPSLTVDVVKSFKNGKTTDTQQTTQQQAQTEEQAEVPTATQSEAAAPTSLVSQYAGQEISNNKAKAILEDAESVAEMTEAGVDLSGTASQRRAAVKEYVAGLESQAQTTTEATGATAQQETATVESELAKAKAVLEAARDEYDNAQSPAEVDTAAEKVRNAQARVEWLEQAGEVVQVVKNRADGYNGDGGEANEQGRNQRGEETLSGISGEHTRADRLGQPGSGRGSGKIEASIDQGAAGKQGETGVARTKQIGDRVYSYNETPPASTNENAALIKSELEQLGVDGFVYDGDLKSETTGRISEGTATTLPDGTVAIRNDNNLPYKEQAAHEALHAHCRKNTPAAVRFRDLANEQINYSNRGETISFLHDIATGYLGENYDLSSPATISVLNNEFPAYVYGLIYDGRADEIRGLFMDADAVIEAANEFTAYARQQGQLKAEQQGTTGNGGSSVSGQLPPGPGLQQTQQGTAVKAGRATKIYSPYQGETPTYSKPDSNIVPNIEKTAVDAAAQQIQKAQQEAKASGGSFKTGVRKFYEKLFAQKGGTRSVTVNGVAFDGAPYEVTLGRRAVSKVVNDPNISAEKLAVFDSIDEVIANGEYVGSGAYSQKGNKVKNTIRYDYFETPVTIDGQSYIVAFDVEVIPGKNNYRTHKVINNMDLILAEGGEAAPVAAAQSAVSSPVTNIANGQQNVNGQNLSENGKSGKQPASLRQRAEQQAAQEARQAEQEAQKAAEEKAKTEREQEIYRKAKDTLEAKEAAEQQAKLTEEENELVKDMLQGKADPNQGDERVRRVYQARLENYAAQREARIAKANARKKYRDLAKKLVKTADAWVDKKIGFAFSSETAERNIRDVIKDSGVAEEVIGEIFDPVHQNEAKSTRLKNMMRDKLRELNLGTEEKFTLPHPDTGEATKFSESALVQLYGEGRITENQLKLSGADVERIANAVNEYRQVYDQLLGLANAALVRNGYAPIKARENYFPHFEDPIPTGFRKALSMMGIEIKEDSLPAEIAGTTADRKPGTPFNPNALERKGDKTDFNAMKGFDRYVETAANVIFHTDDIQRLRAFEKEVRLRNAEEGIRQRISEVEDDPYIDEDHKASMIREILEEDKSHLSHFVTWLRRYTDTLAGKKNFSDRWWEEQLGRAIYDVSTSLEKRVSANMVGLNINSALTNFIPIFQGMGEVKAKYMARGLIEAAKNVVHDDGFVTRSDFLTNRFGSDKLYKTKLEKATDTAGKLFELVDQLASETVTRGRYWQNMLENGAEADAAMSEAGQWAAGLMADRSKGAVPVVFTAKNPVAKAFTMFQIEVNNQYRYMFKDLPRSVQKEAGKGKADVAWALTKMFVATAIYGELFEKVTGRDPTFNPIKMIAELVKGFKDEDKDNGEVVEEFAKDAAGEAPFIGNLFGGGRLPVTEVGESAGDALGAVWDFATGDISGKAAAQEIGSSMGNLAALTLLPLGGNQVKKTIQGLSAVSSGRVSGMDSEGNEKLKYLVDQTPSNWAKGAVFGRWSFPEAQEYVDGGFKAMSAKNTDIVNRAPQEALLPAKTAQKVIQELKDVDGTAAKRKYIHDQKNLTQYQKAWLEHELLASDTVKEKAKLAQSRGIPLNVFYWVKENSGTQEETEAALNRAPSLNRGQKKWMWSVLTGGKEENNPFR